MHSDMGTLRHINQESWRPSDSQPGTFVVQQLEVPRSRDVASQCCWPLQLTSLSVLGFCNVVLSCWKSVDMFDGDSAGKHELNKSRRGDCVSRRNFVRPGIGRHIQHCVGR